jgi:hypothetical protein
MRVKASVASVTGHASPCSVAFRSLNSPARGRRAGAPGPRAAGPESPPEWPSGGGLIKFDSGPPAAPGVTGRGAGRRWGRGRGPSGFAVASRFICEVAPAPLSRLLFTPASISQATQPNYGQFRSEDAKIFGPRLSTFLAYVVRKKKWTLYCF